MKLKCEKCGRTVFDNKARGCMFLVPESECKFCKAEKEEVRKATEIKVERHKSDLEVANRLENLIGYLECDNTISSGKMTIADYVEYVSALRYAVASLRTEE